MNMPSEQRFDLSQTPPPAVIVAIKIVTITAPPQALCAAFLRFH
jgi:hypothetical protein